VRDRCDNDTGVESLGCSVGVDAHADHVIRRRGVPGSNGDRCADAD
jgi:hypothetical protein